MRCLHLGLLGLLPATSAAAADPEGTLHATLTIDHTAPLKPVLSPGRLFGSFFEDFLHAGDGGVYAEKLSNRALALPLANKSSFRCSGAVNTGGCTWYAERGLVTRDSSAPLNEAVPNAMWLGPSAVATNAGFPGGISVRAGDTLMLSLFVNVRAPSASIEARLVDGMEPAGRTLGSVVLTAHGSPTRQQWNRLTAVLHVITSSGSDGCRLQLINLAGTGSPSVGATVVSLFPQRTWLGRRNGLRTDVASWLNESQPAFVRTPGGCYVEGKNLSASGWDWKKTLGPIEHRPGHMNDVWGYWTDDGLGMLELLQMADDVGAQPLLVVNAGCSTGDLTCVTSTSALQPYIQGAIDAVEYVTGASSTRWGGIRAANGRAAPFELQALGIGNENCNGRHFYQYAHNWYAIATAVRAKYPHLPLVLGCQTQDQMMKVLKAEPRIRTLATMYDVHQRKSPTEFLAAAHEFDSYPRAHYPSLFVSEYSSPRKIFPNWTTVGAAVAEAIYMSGMEANGDVVRMATYGDLMANTRDDHGSAGTSTILINAAGSFGSPSWVVQKLFMSAQPAALLPSTLTRTHRTRASASVLGDPLGLREKSSPACVAWANGGGTCIINGTDDSPSAMFAASTSVSTAGAIQAKLVNYGSQVLALTVMLGTGFTLGEHEGTLSWMSGPTPETVNSFEEPRRVSVQERPVTLEERGMVFLQLPPWSVSILKLSL